MKLLLILKTEHTHIEEINYTAEAEKDFERVFMPLHKLIDIFKDNDIQEIKIKSKLSGELFKIIVNRNVFMVEKI